MDSFLYLSPSLKKISVNLVEMSGFPSMTPPPPPPPPHLWGCDNKLGAVAGLHCVFIAARPSGPSQVSVWLALRCFGGPVFHVDGMFRRERL